MTSSGTSTLDLYSWFAKSPIHGLSFWQLAPGAVILAILLGYGFYTDVKGRIIRNEVTVPLIVAGLAVCPLLYPHGGRGAYVIAVVTAFILGGLGFMGAFGMGDAKLLTALALLFHKAILTIFFISGLVAALYAIPLAVVAARERKRGEFEGKIRKIKLQFGPAIAVTTALPVGVSSGRWWAGVGFLGVVLLTYAVCELLAQRPGLEAALVGEHELGDESTTALASEPVPDDASGD